MEADEAISLLRQEMQRAPVPAIPDGARPDDGFAWRMEGESFCLRVEPDSWLHYRRGMGVDVLQGAGTQAYDIDLFAQGTLAAAVVAMNGLYPFHGSAVMAPDGAVVLTGPSGAGKSTLAAGLALHGLPLLADDLTILLECEGAAPTVLPWNKRLKLWEDSLALTRLQAAGLVSEEYTKHFAEAPRAHDAAPLLAVVELSQGELAWERLTGGQALASWSADHYMSQVLAAARGWDRAARFADAAARAAATPAYRLTFPHDPQGFAQLLDFASARLREATA